MAIDDLSRDELPFERRQLANWRRTARTLVEALPYILRYDSKTIVVKYGGNAMGETGVSDHFAQSIVLMKQTGIDPVVVHGGGPQIGSMLDRLGIKSEFIDGLRVTDKHAIEVVEMVLTGSINKAIVTAINSAGGRAIGISGKDGNLVIARKLNRVKKDEAGNVTATIDLGFVGEPETINTQVLKTVMSSDLIPVVAPVGVGKNGETYNINADTVAGAIAGALKADRLLFLTDVPGVMDKDGVIMPSLTVSQAQAMMRDGTISGGMIPKVQTCIDALAAGVEGVVILDGRIPHVLLVELFTEHGAGTLLRRD